MSLTLGHFKFLRGTHDTHPTCRAGQALNLPERVRNDSYCQRWELVGSSPLQVGGGGDWRAAGQLRVTFWKLLSAAASA